MANAVDYVRTHPQVSKGLAGAAAGAGLYLMSKKLIKSFTARQKKLVDNYAIEMLKYDGNTQMLRDIHNEYLRKLGPTQNRDDMILTYMRSFMERKALSGAAIRSLAFFISIHSINDSKAAKLLKKIGDENVDKYTSTVKLLFLADRVLTEDSAKAELQPLRAKVLENTYGTDSKLDVETMFKNSQRLLAVTGLKRFVEKVGIPTDESVAAMREEASLLGLNDSDVEDVIKEVYEE